MTGYLTQLVSKNISTDTFLSYGPTSSVTLSRSVSLTNEIQVFISGVRQHPDTYTVSGTTLTFSSPVSENIPILVDYRGEKAIFGTVSDGAITTNKIADGSITNTKFDSSVIFVPTATVLAYAGTTAPASFLMCYGQAVSRTTYSNLYNVISTTYGTGNGSTTFNVPDLRGRGLFGKDNMGGSAANRITSTSGITGTTLGAVGGDERLHSHGHGVSDGGHSHGYNYPDQGGNIQGGGGETVYRPGETGRNTGSSGANISISAAGAGSSQNMPPAMIVNFIIRI